MKLHKDILYSIGDTVEINNTKYTIELAGWGKIMLVRPNWSVNPTVIEVDNVTAICGSDIIKITKKWK